MTLIITDVSDDGIVMLGDTRLTQDWGKLDTYDDDCRKVQVVGNLGALAIWGIGTIEGERSDRWMTNFITKVAATCTSLQGFADVLCAELQKAIGKGQVDPDRPGRIQNAFGVHLAGYVEADGSVLPALYHLRNVDGPYGGFASYDFTPQLEVPIGSLPGINGTAIWRNGDFGPYASLVDAVAPAIQTISESFGRPVPVSNLGGRMLYHAAWIRFVSDLYAASEIKKTIGTTVHAVQIRHDQVAVKFVMESSNPSPTADASRP